MKKENYTTRENEYEAVFDNPNLSIREKELFDYIDAFLDKLRKIEQ